MTCPACSSCRNCQNILTTTTTTNEERKSNKCDKFSVSTWIRISTSSETLRQVLLHSPPHTLVMTHQYQRDTESGITIYNITNYHIFWIWNTIHDTIWKFFTSTEWKGIGYIKRLQINWPSCGTSRVEWSCFEIRYFSLFNRTLFCLLCIGLT